MASPYHFLTTGSKRVVTCDYSAGGTDTLWDYSSMCDNTISGIHHLHLHRVDIIACATTGFRILDNSTDGNRIVSLPASDVSGTIGGTWEFAPPLELTITEYTRLCGDTTSANQARVTIVYDQGA